MAADNFKSPGKAKEPLGSFVGGTSRRRFLLMTGALASLGAITYASFNLGVKRIIKIARPIAFDSHSPTGWLSDQEMRTMIALLEVLVPIKLWSSRKDMVKMINVATEEYKSKGTLKEYKSGLSLLDRFARVGGVSPRFAELPFDDRQRILESLMWKYDGGRSYGLTNYFSRLMRGLERVFHSEPERRFRDLVVRDLLERFYGGEIAWKMVGYSRHPGIPGDPREYTRPPSSN